MAARFGTERLLMISTDKAVDPRSIMGASKRVAELALLRLSNRNTKMNAEKGTGSPKISGEPGAAAHGRNSKDRLSLGTLDWQSKSWPSS
jgi:hypothetical protein